jgi:ABC-type Fe3+ transport system substrate-binding protein
MALGKTRFDIVIGARGPLALGKRSGCTRNIVRLRRRIFRQIQRQGRTADCVAHHPVGILYNTELVKAGETPKSSMSCSIQMARKNQHAGPVAACEHGAVFWNLQQVKGDKWMDFAKDLASRSRCSGIVFHRAEYPRAGEAHLGISYIQYTRKQRAHRFASIEHVFADPSDAALSAKAMNPNAAKLFIEYCAPRGQKKVAETGEFVLSSRSFPAIKGADKIMSNLT